MRDRNGRTSLAGDLVVDAMGRGSRALQWLSVFGYEEPSVTNVHVNVHYSSRLFSRTAADLQGDKLVIISPTAENPRGAVAFAVEGDRWLVTLFAYGGEKPPTGLAEFRSFARSLVADDIGKLVARSASLDDGAVFFVPTASLRRFDRLRALPDGYLCLGTPSAS